MTGEAYLKWLTGLAPLFREYLKPDGSIVLELGNAWNPGSPTMSTLPLKALLGFLEAGGLNLCQEFICFNPARLPTPTQWVNIERIRVKDAFTRIWWMSPDERPKADNRKVLTKYSKSMMDLLRKGTYNSGQRPSGHNIGAKSFLSNNGGSIPPNVLVPAEQAEGLPLFEVLPISNTRATDDYLEYCRNNGILAHPARMQEKLAEFFVDFLTDDSSSSLGESWDSALRCARVSPGAGQVYRMIPGISRWISHHHHRRTGSEYHRGRRHRSCPGCLGHRYALPKAPPAEPLWRSVPRQAP